MHIFIHSFTHSFRKPLWTIVHRVSGAGLDAVNLTLGKEQRASFRKKAWGLKDEKSVTRSMRVGVQSNRWTSGLSLLARMTGNASYRIARRWKNILVRRNCERTRNDGEQKEKKLWFKLLCLRWDSPGKATAGRLTSCTSSEGTGQCRLLWVKGKWATRTVFYVGLLTVTL